LDTPTLVLILAPTDINAQGKVTCAKLAMAKTLVQQMAGPFDPSKFKDTYRADLKR
jgi:non-homologous end joining protein Ku